MNDTLDGYLDFLHDNGPAAKAFTMKASGAEQDDEEKPTTARTKRFERDEAKVGVVELRGNPQAEQDDEDDPTTARTKRFERKEAKVGVTEFGGNAQLAATPVTNLGSEPLEGGHSDVVGRTNKKYKDDIHDKDDEDKDKIDRELEEIIQNYVF